MYLHHFYALGLYTSNSELRIWDTLMHKWHKHCCGRLESLESELISQNIKLVVVDSVASLIRKEFGGSSSKSVIHRTNLLTRQASLLKYMAQQFSIPVSADGYERV